MANTITNFTMQAGPKRVILYVTIASDGTNETNTVIYNSATQHTTIGDADTKTCKINSIRWVSNSPVGKASLLWDATTKVLALSASYGGNPLNMDFTEIGGLANQGGSGVTGNILLTTTGLASGDQISFILDVRPF